VRGEFAENAIRKDFLPSEIEAIRRAMLPAETVAAKGRMVSAHTAMESFRSKPRLATRSAPLPASLAEPSRTMLRGLACHTSGQTMSVCRHANRRASPIHSACR
jgi:hypothetical protein